VVVQAVVKANSQNNGKRQISSPLGSENPERIWMKHGTYNYIMSTTTHANPCGAATTWVNALYKFTYLLTYLLILEEAMNVVVLD